MIDSLLHHLDFVVFDLETTGLGRDARIVEIAAVRMNEWKPVGEFHTLVNPGIPIPFQASQIHKIDQEMVADAPTFKDISRAVAHFMQGAVLVGHNIFSFDSRFLIAETREAFGTSPNNWAVDTLPLARRCLNMKKNKLEILAEHFDIPLLAHQAMSDVYATAEIWLILAGMLREQGLHKLADLERHKALRQLDGTGLPHISEKQDVRLKPR